MKLSYWLLMAVQYVHASELGRNTFVKRQNNKQIQMRTGVTQRGQRVVFTQQVAALLCEMTLRPPS